MPATDASLPLVINDHDGRGAALEYSATGRNWYAISYADNEQGARDAFNQIPRHKDTNPEHYRISCHSFDVTKHIEGLDD